VGESEQVSPILDGEDIEAYRITAPMEIGAVLRMLAQRGTFITIYVNEGRELILSRILDVDIKGKTFIFDVGGNAGVNQALLSSTRSLVVAIPDGVKVQFAVAVVRNCQHQGRPALTAAFPLDLIKLQRREYYRLLTPVARPYRCQLMFENGVHEWLNVHDVSLGGVGAWVPAKFKQSIEKGHIYNEVPFDFGPAGMMKLNFEVRSLRQLEQRPGQFAWMMGCQFVNLPRQTEANIQRLMAQLEAERKALTG
jgi:flagellar brake protein